MIGFVGIVGALASLDVYAASSRDILDNNGRDYFLANSKTVATQQDDRDEYFLARTLIGNLRSSKAPDIRILSCA
jgi:hypothetical protein